MARTSKATTARGAPRRYLSKEEAVRHLIHGAIRLVMAIEDPFIIHMLIQSADKLLIDLAKKDGKALSFDWEKHIRPERRKEFFGSYRESYNFFKHADADFGEKLPVHEIARFNVITLFVCIQNYRAVYGTITGHMTLHLMFVQATMPGVFTIEPERAASFEEALRGIAEMTPLEFFSIVQEFTQMYAPGFNQERAEDTQDTQPFYSTSFSELHRIDSAT